MKLSEFLKQFEGYPPDAEVHLLGDHKGRPVDAGVYDNDSFRMDGGDPMPDMTLDDASEMALSNSEPIIFVNVAKPKNRSSRLWIEPNLPEGRMAYDTTLGHVARLLEAAASMVVPIEPHHGIDAESPAVMEATGTINQAIDRVTELTIELQKIDIPMENLE